MATPPLWQQSALDALIEHHSTQQPLASITQRIARLRRLGSHDRKHMQACVFDFVRHKNHYLNLIAAEHVGLLIPFHQQMRMALERMLENAEQHSRLEFPAWFVSRIQTAYGDKADALLQALSDRAGPVLAFDRTQVDQKTVLQALDEMGIGYSISPVYASAIRLHAADFSFTKLPPSIRHFVWLMDDASQLAASEVTASKGQNVLDMCAGGGGKSRFMLQTGAHIVSADKSLARLKSALSRPGMKQVQPVVADGLQPPFQPSSFDWVIVDAPCSGTGVLRREPDKIGRLQESDMPVYANLQLQLLQQARNLVKPGGHLLYFTCSILPEENESVVEQFHQKDSASKLVSKRLLLPSQEGCDGFFIAHFQVDNQA